MKNYYVQINGKESEPMTLNQLKKINLKKSTLVWHEGLSDWTPAGNLDELWDIFKSSPPPIKKAVPPSSKRSPTTAPEESRPLLSSSVIRMALGGFALLAAILLFVAYTDTSKSDTKRQMEENTEMLQQQKEQIELQNAKIAEQERLEQERQERERKAAIEKRLNEISTQLALDNQKLDEAKRKLNDASRFVLFRSQSQRNTQINEASEVVKYWENEIDVLTKESDELRS